MLHVVVVRVSNYYSSLAKAWPLSVNTSHNCKNKPGRLVLRSIICLQSRQTRVQSPAYIRSLHVNCINQIVSSELVLRET